MLQDLEGCHKTKRILLGSHVLGGRFRIQHIPHIGGIFRRVGCVWQNGDEEEATLPWHALTVQSSARVESAFRRAESDVDRPGSVLLSSVHVH